VCAHVDARTFEHGPLLVSELHVYHDIFGVTVCARSPGTHPRPRTRPRASLLLATPRRSRLAHDLAPIPDEALARRRAPRQAQSARPRVNRPTLPSLLSGSRTLRGGRSSTEAPGPCLARRRCSRSPGGSCRAHHATAPGTATPPLPRASVGLGAAQATASTGASPSRQDRRPPDVPDRPSQDERGDGHGHGHGHG
jgi:hypothetical protein